MTRLLDGLMMVAARDGEQWVLDALADPRTRLEREQDARRRTLSRAILRLDASASAKVLEGLTIDELQDRVDRL